MWHSFQRPRQSCMCICSWSSLAPGENVFVQNLITELPSHIDVETSKDFEKFSGAAIWDKKQIKGSDAQLFAVKLAIFAYQNHSEKKISEDILHQLCWNYLHMLGPYEQRTPKKKISACITFASNFQCFWEALWAFGRKWLAGNYMGAIFTVWQFMHQKRSGWFLEDHW